MDIRISDESEKLLETGGSKDVARILLAKVYMYQQKWAAASNLLQKVVDLARSQSILGKFLPSVDSSLWADPHR